MSEENIQAGNEGGSRRSKLTFVTAQTSAESRGLTQIEPVREPVSRSKSGVHGKFADTLLGRSRHAESLNELRAFRVLFATGRCDMWQEQPFLLEYRDGGKKHRYVPDILAVWDAYREVVEVKEDSDADLQENLERFGLIRELLSEHGYHFRVWRKSEICAEPRLANAGIVLRYRRVEVSTEEHERIRREFSLVPERPLRRFSETSSVAVHNVLRMVLDGTLHIDWWEPLTLNSRVNISPIGRQVWPSRHSLFGREKSSAK